MYEIGGAAATYALNHAHTALPGLKTLREGRRKFALTISAGVVKRTEVIANINAVCRRARLTRCGHSLALDEIAGAGRLAYLPKTDEMAGWCREHVHRLRAIKMGSDLTNVMEAARAYRNGEVHIGKEFTCAAISRHAETEYGAKPVLLSATCKHGTVLDSVRLIMTCLDAWKHAEHGEATSGPIWAIASDGDATRRASMYVICMQHELSLDSGLYRRLNGCIGLNLFVGDNDITMDFDYKHIFKRLCTLFCSKEGLLVNDVALNKLLISQWLEKLTAYDWSDTSIHALLNPKDPQDVPRAVQLLSRIAELRNLDTSKFSPTEKIVHESLCVLGEALHAFLDPFLNRTLSLSDQITRLAKSAYIFCALYLKHGTSFISNQLYGDIQCMIKNALFHVAKSQELDPELKVFICLLGDDVLEALFGRIRMIGGHSPNVDISEMEARCRSALNLDEVFSEYPAWERKPERLKLQRSRDLDHLRPGDWQGELRAKFCDVEKCMKEAMRQAEETLAQYNLKIDFTARFADRSCDLMKPRPGGQYRGYTKVVFSPVPDADVDDVGNASFRSRFPRMEPPWHMPAMFFLTHSRVQSAFRAQLRPQAAPKHDNV